MTSVCDVAERAPDGSYYGAKLEIPSVHPGLMSAAMGWSSGADFAQSIDQLNRMAAGIVLQRDGGDGGRVTLDASSKNPFVYYRIRPQDQASMLAALEHQLRVFVAAGAEKVGSLHTGLPPYHVPQAERTRAKKDESPGFEAWLKTVRAAGLPRNGVGLFSAHQMGTCRMGADALSSVVDVDGEVWDADALYVIDASIFPTASGANPMVTTLAIAHLLASRLAATLAPAAPFPLSEIEAEKDPNKGAAAVSKTAESDEHGRAVAAARTVRREAARRALSQQAVRWRVLLVCFLVAVCAAVWAYLESITAS